MALDSCGRSADQSVPQQKHCGWQCDKHCLCRIGCKDFELPWFVVSMHAVTARFANVASCGYPYCIDGEVV